MRNVTITLDDDLFAWARVEAAKNGQSLSRYVAKALEERRAPDHAAQVAILNEFFEGPGWPGVAENLSSRDELYDRPALLRHEPAHLRDGPGGSSAAHRQHDVDRESANEPAARREPADSQ